MFPLTCPICRQSLEESAAGNVRCATDGLEFSSRDGIWRFLTGQRRADAERFLADYRKLRRDEGWGTDDDAYYRALPFRDLTGRHQEIWRIRAASHELLRRTVLVGSERRVADLGAGNCWLSWRLTEAGHAVAAVDLSDDARDGLGAAAAYPTADFMRVQAAFDDPLPFADGAFDLVIFNGALHYAGDVRRTLAEAKRLASSTGRIVIMDTPVYRLARSGERMVDARRKEWRERYGPDFGDSPAEGFFTRHRFRRLGTDLGIRWHVRPLPLGWRWHLGPFVALALGRSEPARFPLIVGEIICV